MLRLFRQYYPIRNIFFVIGEFFVICLSAFAANWIFVDVEQIVQNELIFLKILVIAFVCQASLYYNDLYDFKITDSFSELSIRLLQALGAAAIFLSLLYTLFPIISLEMKVFTASIIFDIIFIVSWRFGYAFILNSRVFDEKIFLFGYNELSAKILTEITTRRDCGYIVAGVVSGLSDCTPGEKKPIECDETIKSKTLSYGLCEYALEEGIQKIVVAVDRDEEKFPTDELLRCRIAGIEILEGSTFYEMLTGKLLVDHIKPEWLIFAEGFQKSWARRAVKRTIDLVLSTVMLIVLSPLILVVSALIKMDRKEPGESPVDIWIYFSKVCREQGDSVNNCIRMILREYIKYEREKNSFRLLWGKFREKCVADDTNSAEILLMLVREHIARAENSAETPLKRPVFFSQERIGYGGKKYNIHKFRSMIVNAEKYSGPIWAGEEDKRITRIGRFIRKWRIDEIPQLWNVLKGEMSFVGPRPEREFFIRQLEKVIPYYRERHSVKPGVTGWAQVCYGYGASENDAKEKLNYDLFYIKNMSIPMDLMIVLRTIKIVIFGKGR